MLTLDFFRAVLPDAGPYYVVVLKAGSAPAHKKCDTLEQLTESVEQYDKNPNYAVYFGCAAGTAVEGKKRVTPASTDGRAKALWIDIDCGEDKAAASKGYATKGDAAKALAAFCADAEFPAPMIVDSGGGLHCYWRLTKALPYAQWFALASAFKAVLSSRGLLADETCTADFSRILRPAGTTNRKRGERTVKVLRECREFSPKEILEHLKRLRPSLPAPAAPKLALQGTLNDDLIAHAIINIPTSAEEVANKCAQVAKMRDTLGDVSYDHWRVVIGLIKFCVEGYDLAEKWSSRRIETGHSQNDVKTRYDTWDTDPPICSTFNEKNPGGCDGCPYKDKIKTPMVLGRIMPKEDTEQLVDAVIDGKAEKVQVPALPAGYKWESNVLVRYLRSKDGLLEPHPFSRSLFYPLYRVKREDNTFGIGIRAHTSNGRIRDFDINTGLLASPQKLMEELGHRGELVQVNSKDASMHTTAYLRDALEKMKSEAEEMNTMTSFGWKYDMQAFLIGDRLYHKDGTTRRVLVGGYAADTLSHFPPPKGTCAGYAAALNSVYAGHGMEPFQYAICSGFGSILTPFGENLYHGLLVAITGGATAKGKSTVCHAALYAFGAADKMTIGTQHGSTDNNMYAQLGTYGNIPLLFDEYTDISPEDFSKFAYRISQGWEKGRIISKGGTLRKAAQVEWNLSPFVTANKDLHAILAQHAANSQAEAVRMVQVKIDEYDTQRLPVGVVDAALTRMRMNSGSAGETFVKYCVEHLDEVYDLFRQTMEEVSVHINEQEYRHYRNHATASLTAAKLMVKLGICEFDYPRLFSFTMTLMKKLCSEVVESNLVTPEDALNMLINELNPRILTTDEYRDGRDARGPEYGKRIQQAFAGRHIIGTAKEPLAGRLYLVKKDVKEWCVKHRVDIPAILSFAASRGALISAGERFNITKGTEFAATQVTCIVLNMHALAGVVVAPNLVVHPGGKAVDAKEKPTV